MSKYRIMIVDDDEDARRILTMALRPRYETVEAHDGLDALARLEAYEPDLAIIDIMMPTMDGYQLCQAIRKHPHFSNIPVMFLSAYGSRENARKSYEAGGNLFLTKPVDPERILKNVNFTVEHETPQLHSKRFSMERLEAMTADEIAGLGKPRAERAERLERPPEPETPPERTRRPAHETAPPRPRSAASEPARRARILVVDDDPETRLMIDLTLRDDYEIVKAANGMEAIERMVDCEPDIMLLDIMMPKMNGYQLLQSVRRNPLFHAMPVIVLSAKSARRDREYAEKLGATAYLAKPYHVEDLQMTLVRVMRDPGFRIRPKSRAIEQILASQIPKEKAQQDELQQKGRADRFDGLREVINQGGDDPFSRTRLD